MKIQFASDLHLELMDNSRYLKEHPFQVTGDVLLLAGDTIYIEQVHLMKHPFWQCIGPEAFASKTHTCDWILKPPSI